MHLTSHCLISSRFRVMTGCTPRRFALAAAGRRSTSTARRRRRRTGSRSCRCTACAAGGRARASPRPSRPSAQTQTVVSCEASCQGTGQLTPRTKSTGSQARKSRRGLGSGTVAVLQCWPGSSHTAEFRRCCSTKPSSSLSASDARSCTRSSTLLRRLRLSGGTDTGRSHGREIAPSAQTCRPRQSAATDCLGQQAALARDRCAFRAPLARPPLPNVWISKKAFGIAAKSHSPAFRESATSLPGKMQAVRMLAVALAMARFAAVQASGELPECRHTFPDGNTFDLSGLRKPPM